MLEEYEALEKGNVAHRLYSSSMAGNKACVCACVRACVYAFARVRLRACVCARACARVRVCGGRIVGL